MSQKTFIGLSPNFSIVQTGQTLVYSGGSWIPGDFLSANTSFYTQAEADGRFYSISGGTLYGSIDATGYNVTASTFYGSLNWSYITNKPTTLSGYGITDSYTKTEADSKFVFKTGDTMTGELIINNPGQQALTVVGNVNMTGNLYVSGTTTYVNTEDLNVKDNLITINSGETGAGVSKLFAGILVDRGTLTDYLFIFDEIQDNFRVGESGNTQAVATREDNPYNNGLAIWNDSLKRFDTSSALTFNGYTLWINGDLAVQFVTANTISAINLYGNLDWSYIQNKPNFDSLYYSISGGTIYGDIIPDSDGTRSLGSTNYQWKDLWVSGGTIYLDRIPLTTDGIDLYWNNNILQTSITYAAHDERYVLKTGDTMTGELSIVKNQSSPLQLKVYNQFTSNSLNWLSMGSRLVLSSTTKAAWVSYDNSTNGGSSAGHMRIYSPSGLFIESPSTYHSWSFQLATKMADATTPDVLIRATPSGNNNIFSLYTRYGGSTWSQIRIGDTTTNYSYWKSDTLGNQSWGRYNVSETDFMTCNSAGTFWINNLSAGTLTVPTLTATTISATTTLTTTLTANTISASTYYGINFDNTHTDAYNNVTVGIYAGNSLNSSTTYNTLIGVNAGYNINSGYDNTFVGYNTGYYTGSGYYNTFIGNNAGYSNYNGYLNTFIGNEAGRNNSNGYLNTFLGSFAGYNNNKGVQNVFIGSYASYSFQNYYNVFIGYRVGYHNQGNDNVFIGYDSCYSGNTSRSVHVGRETGYRNNGVENVFVGYRSGYFGIVSSSFNTCVGTYSGYKISEGGSNSFFGYQVGYNTQGGTRNNYFGYQAGYSNVQGYDNVYIGYKTGYYNESGNTNVFVGNFAGFNNSGNSNIFIGYQAGYNESGSNMLYISNSNTSSPLIKGSFSENILMFNADVEIKINQSYYIGPKDTEGTWKISVVNGNLEISKYTGGTYVVGQFVIIK